MPGPIWKYFAGEHARLEAVLSECLAAGGEVDVGQFDAFRRLLLWHIAQEERVLFPALTKRLGRSPEFRNAARKDHAGLAALCVPMPDREWVENLSELLHHHAAIEDGPDGLYALCDTHLSDQADALLAEAAALPPLTLAPFEAGPWVRARVAQVLQETGIEPAAS